MEIFLSEKIQELLKIKCYAYANNMYYDKIKSITWNLI